jgi:hypothetical protein
MTSGPAPAFELARIRGSFVEASVMNLKKLMLRWRPAAGPAEPPTALSFKKAVEGERPPPRSHLVAS